eukprot:IDg6948t1
MSLEVDEALAAQRIRAEDGVRVDNPLAKKASEAPAPMSMRISLYRWYEYAVAVRAEGIGIVPLVSGEAGGFPFYRR